VSDVLALGSRVEDHIVICCVASTCIVSHSNWRFTIVFCRVFVEAETSELCIAVKLIASCGKFVRHSSEIESESDCVLLRGCMADGVCAADRHRPYLMTRVQGTNDYINAVFVDVCIN